MIERLFNICMGLKEVWGRIRFKWKILAYKSKLDDKDRKQL